VIPWEKALEIASKLTLPIPVVGFALVFVVIAYYLALRSRKRNVALFLLVALLAVILLGLAPLFASVYVRTQVIYRISLQVLGTDGQSVRTAVVTSLPPAQIKKMDAVWEVEIPPQIRPADGTVLLTASVSDAYLQGSTKITLARDYFPIASIQLAPLPAVTVRGTVLDDHGRPLPEAKVALEGYPEVATTNEMGNFQIASRHARGQQVTVMAQKDGASAKKTGPAGDGFELILRKP
jgi:hypothetical protein